MKASACSQQKVELLPHELQFYLYAKNTDGPSWNALIERIYYDAWGWSLHWDEKKAFSEAVEICKDYLAEIFFTYTCYHVENKRAFFRVKYETLNNVAARIVADEFMEFEIGNTPA